MSELTEVVVTHRLSRREARELTDHIKTSAERLWAMLLDAYEGGAHTALGYSSWGAYCTAEFDTSKSRAYELVNAGIVVRAIEAHSAIAERPNEAQARPLAALAKEDPEEAARLWECLIEEYGHFINATHVKQAIKERAGYEDRKRALPPKTRAIVEQADENYDKHSDILRNSSQMNRLASIANAHGDDTAAEVVQRALTEDGSNIYRAADEVLEEEMQQEFKVEVVKAPLLCPSCRAPEKSWGRNPYHHNDGEEF